MNNNQSIYGDVFNSDSKNRAMTDIYSSWSVENNLQNQTVKAFNGLDKLMKAIDSAMISSDVIDDKRRVEEYKLLFDKIAYMTDKFAQEFKTKYEQMTDLYVTEKVAGTFNQQEDQYGLCSESPGFLRDANEDEDKNSW